MDHILAIDQGTTGSRAIIYDRCGRQQAAAYRELPQHFPMPGWVEHDPLGIWQGVLDSVQEALQKAPHCSIAAIGITNQRETTVVWDRETGEPIHNAIVWQCRRTSERCDELRVLGHENTIRRVTGLPLDAYFSAAKIEWILRNVPGAMEKAQRGDLLFGTTDSWVLWKLTRGACHATDLTNASRTMLLDIDKQDWSDEMLDLFGIPRRMLPRLVPSSGAVGRTVAQDGIPAGIPICGLAGDQQAALFGQACFQPGTIKNTYGTGSFILLNAGQTRPVSNHGLITTIACGPAGEPVYALEGAVFVSGAAIQWLRDGLGILASAQESERVAASVPDNGGVYFVPALAGLGAPHWDQDARGSVFGLTRGTTSAHLVRAALEAMCYQTRDVLDAMRADTGLEIDSIRVDGGASANDFLCQFQADILGVGVVRPKQVETTSLGAAYLAGLAIGYWENAADISACWEMDRVFEPSMPRAQAESLYQGWLDAVRRTLTRA